MFNRRKFLKLTRISASLSAIGTGVTAKTVFNPSIQQNKPIVISTRDFGIAENHAVWKVLSASGGALDAVEQRIK